MNSGLAAISAHFLRPGTIGFGGPIALVGSMQRDLVERRRWVTEEEFREGLTLAQLAPGPLAAQLAIYVGWLRGRLAGATLVAIAFVAPSFLMVMALSVLYVRYGGLPWMAAAFYGIGAAVIAIIARSAVRLAFIGYLVRGGAGAVIAALGMFLPTYLVVVALAPWFQRISRQRAARAFVTGVTAAAAGAIAGAAFVLGRWALVDGTTIAIACAALLLLDRRLHVPEPIVILLAGVAGLALYA